MKTIENMRNIIGIAILTALIIPAMQHCAALPEKTEIPEAEQKALDKRLFDAIQSRNHNIVQNVLKQGANPNAHSDQWQPDTALIFAAKQHADERYTVSIIRELIKAGADLNSNDQPNNTALMWSAHKSNLTVAKKLINANTDLNMQDEYSRTALMNTMLCDRKSMITLLIKAGADDSLKSDAGSTALDLARSDEAREMLQQAVTARNHAFQNYTLSRPEATLQNAHGYLLNGPLAITPLAGIFLQYATEYVPIEVAKQRAIEATERQKRRAEKTRKNALLWRAQ
jgi:hypothetical protein